MHEGWEYVVAAYGLAGTLLGVWFWMIVRKLRAHAPSKDEARG